MTAENKSFGDSQNFTKSSTTLDLTAAMTMEFDNKTQEELAALKQDFCELLQDQRTVLNHVQSQIDYIKQLNECHHQISTNTEEQTLNEEESQMLSKLKEHIMMCCQMTGIEIDFRLQSYSIKTLDMYNIVKHYKFYMLCMSLEVKIIVDLLIDMREVKQNYQVEKLQIRLKDKDISMSIDETLAELEKSKDLVNAIRFLSSYGCLREKRRTVFTNLEWSEESSECVMFPNTTSGETITIFDPDWPDIKIHVKWVIQQNVMFRAESNFFVLCKVSRSKTAYPKADFIANLPKLFKQLVQKDGEEAALRCLVTMMKT